MIIFVLICGLFFAFLFYLDRCEWKRDQEYLKEQKEYYAGPLEEFEKKYSDACVKYFSTRLEKQKLEDMFRNGYPRDRAEASIKLDELKLRDLEDKMRTALYEYKMAIKSRSDNAARNQADR